MARKKITDSLFRWDFSCLDDNTAYFYFRNHNKLLCVEYWVDEDKVADLAQYFTIDGDEIEDDFKYLSEQEKKDYSDFCKSEISKEQ